MQPQQMRVSEMDMCAFDRLTSIDPGRPREAAPRRDRLNAAAAREKAPGWLKYTHEHKHLEFCVQAIAGMAN
jgi:hypothetical protein